MTTMERTGKRLSSGSGTVVDARMSFSLWLRTGRSDRGMSLQDVARVTKIQSRFLERLEAGMLEGLPADVFVRGFVRSFARCVGLDEAEALRRYGACGKADGSIGQATPAMTTTARALVDTMSDLAPITSSSVSGSPVMLTSPALADGTMRMTSAAIVASAAAAIASSELLAEALDAPQRSTAEVDIPITVEDAAPAIDVAPPVVAEAPAPKKRRRAAAGTTPPKVAKPRSRRKALAAGTDASPVVVPPANANATSDVVADAVVAIATDAIAANEVVANDAVVDAVAHATVADDASEVALEVVAASETREVTVIDAAPAAEDLWAPRMPPLATTTTVPWRRPSNTSHTTLAAPTIVIDDADPESAERELEERKEPVAAARRSFLPPILLDREDRSARQGGLTLAVIILLIAATLTLSYLMRRPSSSGEGVTCVETPLVVG